MYRGKNKTDAGRTSSKKTARKAKSAKPQKLICMRKTALSPEPTVPRPSYLLLLLLLLLLLVYAAKMRNFVLWALAKWLCPFVCLSACWTSAALCASVEAQVTVTGRAIADGSSTFLIPVFRLLGFMRQSTNMLNVYLIRDSSAHS